ncbi:phage antirepressor KilAC domain-containing protein [Listeria monocytogenes]
MEAQRPKVLFADAVSDTEGTILIRDLAKLIQQNGVDIGEKRLFEWLRQNGYLISRRGTDYNRPTQKSMELGLFKIKETAIMRSSGAHTAITAKVTGKGQLYFVNKFLEQSLVAN